MVMGARSEAQQIQRLTPSAVLFCSTLFLIPENSLAVLDRLLSSELLCTVILRLLILRHLSAPSKHLTC